jgi:dimethylhistidine N-methyltransferase
VLDQIQFADEEAPEGSTSRAEFLASVYAGLSAAQKTLECKYLYDERGSELFDQICDLPEYYPTRTEISILQDCEQEIAEALGSGIEIVELGSGASLKTRLLLGALDQPSLYVPIDISEDFLLSVACKLREEFSELRVDPIVADFMRPFALPEKGASKRLLFFPGSTIGNLHREEAGVFLADLHASTDADQFLIGVDLKKYAGVLHAAYDDAAGITAEFNLNMLRRINRELGATFDLDKFEHSAPYNAARGRVEMHLVSKIKQQVRVHDRYYDFTAGETIHSENSYKYDLEEFESLVEKAGWSKRKVWTDKKGYFAVFLLDATR